MNNKFYVNNSNCSYTDKQIQNHNQQIDKILETVELCGGEQYNDYFLDSMKNFSDSFCNSISKTNLDGDAEIYKNFI